MSENEPEVLPYDGPTKPIICQTCMQPASSQYVFQAGGRLGLVRVELNLCSGCLDYEMADGRSFRSVAMGFVEAWTKALDAVRRSMHEADRSN